jgi:hemerythrin HHE cation binding domain-containing protein
MRVDALKLLEEDHKEFKKMMGELEETTERALKTREKLSAKFREELRLHEQIEEEIFYPALIARFKDDDIVLEGYEEHHAADVLMDELEDVPFADERWGAKFKVIKENIEHHIEEEEGPMWKQVKKSFKPAELEELGARMEERKKALATA